MQPDAPQRWTSDRATALLLLAFALALGALVLRFDWTWDDRALIVGAPLEPLGPALRTAWTSDFWTLVAPGEAHVSGMYRPLVTTTYILGRALGLGSGAAHLVNLGLHLGVAWLAGRLAARLDADPFVATAVVLLHPHASELLGNVSARTDLLAGLLVLGSLLARNRGASAALLALGCLSKEVAFVGVLLHPLVHRDLHRSWPPALAAACVLVLRFVLLPASDLSLLGDPLAAASSSGQAFLDLLLPLDAGPLPQAPPLWPGLVALGGVGLLCLRAPARLPVLWVLVCWAPMAGWVDLEVRASRALLYLPAIGLALGLGRLARGLGQRSPGALELLRPAPLLLAFALLPRLLHWQDPLSLWTWGVERNPQSPMARLNLGRAHAERGELEPARRAWSSAAALAMKQEDATVFVKAATSLGQAAVDQGRPAEARTYLEDAVRVAGPGVALEAEAELEALGTP